MTRCPWACYLSCSQCVHQCERWVESEKKWLYACVCEWVVEKNGTEKNRSIYAHQWLCRKLFCQRRNHGFKMRHRSFLLLYITDIKKNKKLFCAMFSSHSSNSSTARRSSKERNDFILETWAWRNCQCIGSLTEKSECLLYFWSLFGIFGKSSSSSVYS